MTKRDLSLDSSSNTPFMIGKYYKIKIKLIRLNIEKKK